MNSEACTILHIEDDDDDVFLFRRALSRSAVKCDIRNVSSLPDAEAYLNGQGDYADRQKHPVPDLIVTDLAFRGGSGLDFLNWLRYESRFASLPVICVTGSDDPGKLDQARGFGITCLPKTTLFENAVEVIREVLAT